MSKRTFSSDIPLLSPTCSYSFDFIPYLGSLIPSQWFICPTQDSFSVSLPLIIRTLCSLQ